MTKDEQNPLAAELAQKGLFLERHEEGLVLTDGTLSLRGDFRRMLPRIEQNNLRGELLVRAAKLKKDPEESAETYRRARGAEGRAHGEAICKGTLVDATAGMGEDSLLLAAAGFSVTMFELDPVIALLLEDAMERARVLPELEEIINRMTLVRGNSIAGMKDLHPDVIYLDPMFPERTKSALVKKKFQLLHILEKPCEDEAELLEAAVSANPEKIVIKRPLKGPYLAGKKPSYSMRGKAVRYDCLVFPGNRKQDV